MKAIKFLNVPLTGWLIIALIAGAITGHFLGGKAAILKPVGALILQLLRLVATPFVFLTVVRSLIKSNISGRSGARLFYILITNTLAAIFFGLLVVNIVRPGHWIHLAVPSSPLTAQKLDFIGMLLGKVPLNLIDPFQSNDIISILLVAFVVGLSLRAVKSTEISEHNNGYRSIVTIVDTLFDSTLVVLNWVFAVVPLAVFAVVTVAVGASGVKPLLSLGYFVAAVVLALLLQVGFYLVRLKFGSWVTPRRFLSGGKQAALMAFSTASSAATLPLTYSSVRKDIGVREESASLGVMVGGTFNHDGAALYEAMAALFVAQAIGLHFSIAQQALVVLMAILASVGAAGIPGAGMVTIFAVFSAVHLPTEYVALLLPLDWFLDRCRTAVSVIGDMALTCLFDGKVGHLDVSLLRENEEAVPVPV